MAVVDLGELSIVVPTFGRHEFALRQMKFWSKHEAKLFVLDGSTEPIPTSDLAGLGPNITYLHMPITLEERLVHGAGLVETKYAMFMADDEFFIPSAIRSFVHFLSLNDEFFAVTGRCVDFYRRRSRVLGRQRYRNFTNYPPEARSLRNIDRLEKFGWGPHMSHYGVFRADHWKHLVRSAYRRSYSCAYPPEVLFNLLTTYMGNTIMLDELYWLRSGENPEVSTSLYDRSYYLDQWYEDPRMVEEVSDFKHSLANAITGVGTDSYDVARLVVEHLLNNYVTEYKTKNVGFTRLQLLRRGFFESIPAALKEPLKRILPKAVLGKLGYDAEPLIMVAKSMASRGIRVGFDELEMIEGILLAGPTRRS